jgi:hypothetical protein
MKTKRKLSPCKVVPAGDPNPRTLAVYTSEVQALLRATHKYTIGEAKHATSTADWGTLVRTAWFSGKAPCWSADHIAKFDSGGGTPMRGKSAKKSSRTAGAITRKRGRDPNCFRSTRTNLHTHTVCPSKPGIYTTSRDFGHTHTVKFKKGAAVTTSEDYGHTHDFDFSVTNGRSPQRRKFKATRSRRDPSMDAPFQGFAFVFKKIPSERAESPMGRGGSPYNKALRAAQKIANTEGETVYVDHITRGGRKYWIIWERRYEGQYTKAEEKHLIDLRDVPRSRSVEVSPSKKGRDPSKKRSGERSVADKHQLRILIDTVKNPMKGMFLGGPSAEEAEETLRHKFHYTNAQIQGLKSNRDPAHRSKAKRRATSSYKRSAKSKRKLARRATPRCTTLLKRLTSLAKASVTYRRAGRNLASRDAWTLMERASKLAVKAGCGEAQISEAVEDGLVAGRKSR